MLKHTVHYGMNCSTKYTQICNINLFEKFHKKRKKKIVKNVSGINWVLKI